jgi:hypothetical protein
MAAMIVRHGLDHDGANSLSVSIQLALPDWVRARGMAIYQMAIDGRQRAGRRGLGPGGQLEQRLHSLLIAAASGAAVMLVVLRLVSDLGRSRT